MICRDFELKRVEAKFHGDAHASVVDRPSSVKREAASHSCVNAAALRQRYRRENVYFQSTFAAVAEGTLYTVCMYVCTPSVVSQRRLIRRGIDEWKITCSAYAQLQP